MVWPLSLFVVIQSIPGQEWGCGREGMGALAPRAAPDLGGCGSVCGVCPAPGPALPVPLSLPSCSALPAQLLQPKHALAVLPWQVVEETLI